MGAGANKREADFPVSAPLAPGTFHFSSFNEPLHEACEFICTRGPTADVFFRLARHRPLAASSCFHLRLSRIHATIPYLSIALVNPLFFFAGLREGEKKKASRRLKVQTDGMFQSECVFALKVCVINRCLLFYPAVPRRPSSAARGEVSTMAPPLRDPTPASMASHLPFLLLLLLPPCVLAQSSALPATPNASSADPPTRPAECAKKEHPKVSIQGQNPHPV